MRMATSWAFASINHNHSLDLVIGRVYGDQKGEFGDLLVYTDPQNPISPTQHAQVLPSERGIKNLLYTDLGDGKALYFSDGWVAAYGKKAKARLKRINWNHQRPSVELLASSPKEFTFFELFVKKDKENHPRLFARGNLGMNLITPQKVGPWHTQKLVSLPSIINASVGKTKQGWFVYIPSETQVQAVSFILPHSPSSKK